MIRPPRLAFLSLVLIASSAIAQPAPDGQRGPRDPVANWEGFVRAKVAYNLHAPKKLPRGVTHMVIHFAIEADGHVRDVGVSMPSPCSACDAAAVRAVEISSPFPPIPVEMNKDHVDLNLPIGLAGGPPRPAPKRHAI